MMRLITIIAAFILLLSSCTKNLMIDYEPNVNFEAYKTYSWNDLDGQHKNVYHNQTEIDSAIKTRMNQLLETKGLTKVNGGGGDFFIDYHIYIEDKTYEIDYCPTGFYNHQGLLTNLITGPNCDVAERTIVYDSGTLVIDVVDRLTGQLVWRGTALQVIDNPLFAPDLLSKKASKLLRGFMKSTNLIL